MAYICMLEKKFDNFRKSSTSLNKSLCWTCVHRFLETNCPLLFKVSSGEQVSLFIINVLMKYDCNDKTIFCRLIEHYFRWHFRNCEDCQGPEIEYINTIMHPFRILAVEPRRTTYPYMNVGVLPICVTDVRLLVILSKYGIHTGRSVFSYDKAGKILKKFMLSLEEKEWVNFHSPEQLSNLVERSLNIWSKTQGRLLFSGNQRGMRYIHLMIKILYAMNLHFDDSPSLPSYIKYLRVLYMTIPDPFVSQEDMTEFLRVLRVFFPLDFDCQAVLTEVYLIFFMNESPKLYCPRSLKHLCRVSLRNTLKQSVLKKNLGLLPHAVKRLHIPRELHDYILCIESINI